MARVHLQRSRNPGIRLPCSGPLPRGNARNDHRLLKEGATMSNVTLNVPDISCEHCERAITNALTPVESVRNVRVDIPGEPVRADTDDAHGNVATIKDTL